mmetsp:Transcript_32229/g.69827  ORF Transcript_32229/g.69827 Transcript_32229/m.69827 type:complete len:153 (+) Transcript_32229:223-681(+)
MGRTKKIARKRPRRRSILGRGGGDAGRDRRRETSWSEQEKETMVDAPRARTASIPPAAAAASSAAAVIVSIASSSVAGGDVGKSRDTKEHKDEQLQPQLEAEPREIDDDECSVGSHRLDIANSSAVRALLSERSSKDRGNGGNGSSNGKWQQ